MTNNKPQLIVALDVDTAKEAEKLVDALSGAVEIFKIGSQLFTACGPDIVKKISAKGKKVFLDLKFHDIPNTVALSVASAVNIGGVYMMTVHTIGGLEMMQRAAGSARETARKKKVEKPLVVGVTVLTSQQKDDNIAAVVLERAMLAKQAGLDGVVASVQEADVISKKMGKDFVIVTPGIRPAGGDVGDQKRVATPREAILNGSHFLVVGRPILEAKDPLQAAKDILKEMSSL